MLELTFFTSVQQFLIIGGIIFLSQFVYSAIGFGSGMIAISLLTLLYGQIDLFVPFFTLLCLPAEAWISIKDRHQINYQHTWIFLVFIIPALFLGSLLLKQESNQRLLLLLGAVIVIFALYYLFFEDRIRFNLQHRGWLLFFGVLSGVLGGLFAIGGPPLIFYFKSIRLNKTEFRVALMSIFLAMTIARFVIYVGLGFYSVPMLWSMGLTLLFAVAGLIAGMRFHDLLPETLFKRLTSFVLFISGLLLFLKNF